MTVLSHAQWTQIDEIIMSINEENDIYAMRKNFLRGIATLIPHEKSFFDLGYKKNTKVVFFDPVSNNMDDKFLVSYFKEYEAVDIMFWFFSQNQTNIYRESDYITDTMREASIFYREWLLPQNLKYSMGSRVTYGDVLFGSVNLWRSPESGNFTDDEIYILTVLNKHLALHFYNKFPNGIRRNSENEYTDTLIHLYNLTTRESEVVSLIYEGLSIREISEKLFISENTVKKHTHNIIRKMKISSRSQLIKIVYGYMTTSGNNMISE